MAKKLMLQIVAVLLAIVAVLYISIRNFRFKPGFPENTVISSTAKPTQWRGVDSVLLKASDMYVASAYRKAIMGTNYREAWDAPIKVPIVWLDTLHGGLRPIKSGGGGQTRSLTMMDPEGQVYTLRSVCKDARARIPTLGTQIQLENLVIDGISAGHPYAALPVAKLCEAVGLLHSHPRLLFVPAQPALDTFNQAFGNRLYTLEYEPNGNHAHWTGIDNASSLMESQDVTDQLMANPLHRTDQQTMLRARLFDLTIGDWDRHQGNWGWVERPEKDGVVYVPIPVDRDMAFYGIGGVVPWLLNRPGELENFRPFGEKIDYLPGVVYNARNFDPFFLSEMTREDYRRAASELQEMLTDERIRDAFRTWPDTIFKLNGPEIIQHIIARRNDLPQYAEAFYELLAQQPQVMGTHQVDSFVVHADAKKQVVELYSSIGKGEYVRKYRRTFLVDETAEITLFGWDGDDLLEVQGKLSIPVNFVGGEGKDRFDLKPSTRIVQSRITLIDDPGGMSMPKGYILANKEIKAKMPLE